MVTWNVATAEPPEDVTSLLQLDVQPPTDLYVIGWEITIWKWDLKLFPGIVLKDKSVSFNDLARKRKKRSHVSVCCVSHVFVLVCWQPAGGERHPCEVHLWPVSGGLLEPCLHGHTGTQRLCQGERGQRERKGNSTVCKQKLRMWVLCICVYLDVCT